MTIQIERDSSGAAVAVAVAAVQPLGVVSLCLPCFGGVGGGWQLRGAGGTPPLPSPNLRSCCSAETAYEQQLCKFGEGRGGVRLGPGNVALVRCRSQNARTFAGIVLLHLMPEEKKSKVLTRPSLQAMSSGPKEVKSACFASHCQWHYHCTTACLAIAVAAAVAIASVVAFWLAWHWI